MKVFALYSNECWSYLKSSSYSKSSGSNYPFPMGLAISEIVLFDDAFNIYAIAPPKNNPSKVNVSQISTSLIFPK